MRVQFRRKQTGAFTVRRRVYLTPSCNSVQLSTSAERFEILSTMVVSALLTHLVIILPPMLRLRNEGRRELITMGKHYRRNTIYIH